MAPRKSPPQKLGAIQNSNLGFSYAGQNPEKNQMSDYNVHFENELVAALPAEVYRRLAGQFTLINFKLGEIILEYQAPMNYLYFPIGNTLASVVATTNSGASVEIGMIAAEGVVAASTCLGATKSPHQILTQAPGKALRISTADFLAEFSREAEVRAIVLGYCDRFFTIVAQTALCNRVHQLQERLGRWLLMTHDRVKTLSFPMTQDFLAKMLGANRASVSEACTSFQNRGIISYKRGELLIVDRPALEAATCECYAFISNHFGRKS